jgi:glycosyltransferase involved in cell wall biosynthesis
LLRELDIRPDQLVVALFGNLTERKRPQEFVRAALLALERDPELIFLVVGSGTEREAVCQMVHNAIAANHFRILERVAYERMPDFFRLADMVVSTSEAEGMSRVYLETMASARVLIASDIPAARDLIRKDETGLMFPVGDTAELARLILETGADATLRARLGENARQYVVGAHSLVRAIDAYCAALEAVAAL